MYFTPLTTKFINTQLSDELVKNPSYVDTLDGFAYLKYLDLGTTKDNITVTTKNDKIYVNVTDQEATQCFAYPLIGRERLKKVSFIEDLGLLILYVDCPTESEEPVRHPIL